MRSYQPEPKNTLFDQKREKNLPKKNLKRSIRSCVFGLSLTAAAIIYICARLLYAFT